VASTQRSAPRDCPVCGSQLSVTRVSCESCDTELSGRFDSCDFCALAADERELLKVFLASRGNMKELERHLGVSYPTARSRFDSLLARLHIEPAAAVQSRVELMERVAHGELSVDDALQQLS
jgi:hypothetical protein